MKKLLHKSTGPESILALRTVSKSYGQSWMRKFINIMPKTRRAPGARSATRSESLETAVRRLKDG